MACSTNEKIRILREMHGYYQKNMAAIMGISQQDYSYLERHIDELTEKQLTKILDALGITHKFFQEFDPTTVFTKIQPCSLSSGRQIVDLPTFQEVKSDGISDLNDLIIILKKQIARQQKNILGLRKQNKILNGIVKEHCTTIRKQNKIILEQQQLLKAHLAGIYSGK
ncbi:MAG: XRE family transcriptional regulator [Chitinophagaceae bacterium]|jgi:transcriptional regulator with XRE-family HTH domain|nr:MAG: XRE family transcriptional regulator [Chitinophagaceae bacterium]